MAEIEEKKRALRKSNITRINNEVAGWTPQSPPDLEFVKTKIAMLQEAHTEFKELHDSIMSKLTDAKRLEDSYDYQLQVNDTYAVALSALQRWQRHLEKLENPPRAPDPSMEQVFRALAEQLGNRPAPESVSPSPVLQDILSKLVEQQASLAIRVGSSSTGSASSTSSSHRHHDLHLQALSIKKFSGAYEQWPEFEDAFTSHVISKGYSGYDKLRYLKLYVEGEAANEIKHLATVEANFTTAWDRLKSRFKRDRYIINNLVNTFLEQPPVKVTSLPAIRSVLSTSRDVIQSLDALSTQENRANERDPWIISLLLGKVDPKTRESCASYSVDKDLKSPKTDDFLTFLQNRCESIELGQPPADKCTEAPRETDKSTRAGKTVRANQAELEKCSVCNAAHRLADCKQFEQLTVANRREHVKTKKLCFNCLGKSHSVQSCKSTRSCKSCGRRHHSLICVDEGRAKVSASVAQFNQNINILPTIQARVWDRFGRTHMATCLVDTGSEASFCTENFAQLLQLERRNARIAVTGVGGGEAGTTRGRSQIRVAPHYSSREVLEIDVLIVPKLNQINSSRAFEMPSGDAHTQLKLADPDFARSRSIDVIVGGAVFFHILRAGKKSPWGRQGPVAVETTFGWLVAGAPDLAEVDQCNSLVATVRIVDESSLDRQLRAFWEVEETGIRGQVSAVERAGQVGSGDMFWRESSGQFVAKLPFDTSKPQVGDSLPAAIACLRQMERKFNSNADFKDNYRKFMREYADLGHMQRVPDEEVNRPSGKVFYMPHHGVHSSGKFRVVFNGSRQAQGGISLNERLIVGPNVQRDLVSIILSFRLHRYAAVADVEKMYRMVKVPEEDADMQRIVWRENRDRPIEHWRLNTVVYGTASASYCATQPLNLLAEEHAQTNPKVSKIIRDNFYVDDVMFGDDELLEATRVQQDLMKILESVSFRLKKWAANHPALLEGIPPENRLLQPHQLELSGDNTVKALGISWNPAADAFCYKVKQLRKGRITKREFLSESAKLFDPLGWVAPLIVAIKIQFQKLWLHDIDWDDEIPPEVQAKWNQFVEEIPSIESISIPRWLPRANQTLELIGFADASTSAYAAVVYARTIDDDGEPQIRLLMAKTKVAPIKPLTIPRLELCAAVLLSRLVSLVTKAFEPLQPKITTFSDSMVVLAWLSSPPRRWTTFVQNRCGEILETLPKSKWHHVAGVENPADLASRGLSPSETVSSELWWQGPPWLKKERENWPLDERVEEVKEASQEERRATVQIHAAQVQQPILRQLQERFSSYQRLLRVTAMVRRLIFNFNKPKSDQVIGRIKVDEIRAVEKAHIKFSQSQYFKDEICALKSNKEVSKKSEIANLLPFLDDQGILRVNGRLQKSNLPFGRKHPVILHPRSPMARLLVEHLHKIHLHAAPTLLTNLLRQRFWIPQSRSLIRSVCHKCVTCFRHGEAKRPIYPIMGQLPSPRSNPTFKCFVKVGVDYAGPIKLRPSVGRGNTTIKAYICLFVCLSSRAIHLECATDLSSEAFLKCFKRFAARRGLPTDAYSDNGTNFVGADRQMREQMVQVIKQLDSEPVRAHFTNLGINWHFNPPSAPHMGGIWEAGVRSVKKHLARVLDERTLTFEEYSTLLCEIEACVNSRPLTPLHESPDELDALTPGHFLVLQPLLCLPEPDTTQQRITALDRYQILRQIVEDFWRRCSIEYLSSLQPRGKWSRQTPAPKVGDLVLVREDNSPPSAWDLGRITDLHPGPDDVVRVVTLRHQGGTMVRPVTKIAKLPIDQPTSDS